MALVDGFLKEKLDKIQSLGRLFPHPVHSSISVTLAAASATVGLFKKIQVDFASGVQAVHVGSSAVFWVFCQLLGILPASLPDLLNLLMTVEELGLSPAECFSLVFPT